MKRSNRNGIALITVMCFLMAIAILGTVFSIAVGTHVRGTAREMDMESALLLAEAGAEQGAAYVAAGGTIPHAFSGESPLGNGTYYVTITATDNAQGGGAVAGTININPNNRTDYEFTLTLPGGETITRDDLHSEHEGYSGPATSVRVQPKGNGNQNSLTFNGETYPLENGQIYLISATDMDVHLFNDKIRNGRAMGKWYISISATGATLTQPDE